MDIIIFCYNNIKTGAVMIELVLLVPFFVVGLILFYYVDMRQPQNKTESLESLMEEVKQEAIDEMKEKLIYYYGMEVIKQKNFQTYEEFYEEMTNIERKKFYAE